MSIASRRRRQFREKCKTERCFYCNEKIVGNWTVDHIWPRTFGGLDVLQNMVKCCFRCNLIKGSLPPMFFACHREAIERAYDEERLIFQNLVEQP
jgi:5-methylcytosine-specific restriction endonuclease McrA